MSHRTVGALASALAAAMFGSAYVATAFQLHGFTPLGAAFWRAAVAMTTLLAVQGALRLGRRRAARATERGASDHGTAGRAWRIVVVGLLGGPIFYVGMNLAVANVGSTVSSFVAGLYAITGALFAPFILREPLRPLALAGFGLAVVGTALLADLGPSPGVLVGLAAGGVAAVSFGLNLNLVRRWSRRIRIGPLGIALATVTATTVALGVYLALTAPGALLPRPGSGPEVLVATTWLAFVAAVGPALTTFSVRRVEAALASSMLLVNPITATLLSALLLGERPSPLQLAGGGLVLVGMALATDVVRLVARRLAERPGTPA